MGGSHPGSEPASDSTWPQALGLVWLSSPALNFASERAMVLEHPGLRSVEWRRFSFGNQPRLLMAAGAFHFALSAHDKSRLSKTVPVVYSHCWGQR